MVRTTAQKTGALKRAPVLECIGTYGWWTKTLYAILCSSFVANRANSYLYALIMQVQITICFSLAVMWLMTATIIWGKALRLIIFALIHFVLSVPYHPHQENSRIRQQCRCTKHYPPNHQISSCLVVHIHFQFHSSEFYLINCWKDQATTPYETVKKKGAPTSEWCTPFIADVSLYSPGYCSKGERFPFAEVMK